MGLSVMVGLDPAIGAVCELIQIYETLSII
jgi:hypothetical protein